MRRLPCSTLFPYTTLFRSVLVAAVAGVPLRTGLALGVIVGKAQVGHLHADGLAAQLPAQAGRSEEHTSELQSHSDLVCRLLLEKKKIVEHPALVTLGHSS